MKTTYRLHTNEITTDLLQSIKAAFGNREIEIIVSDELDDTEKIRNYTADEDSFRFWMVEEEDLYQDYLTKKPS
jgi:hypothetical protein